MTRVGVVFGGPSAEHDVSCSSALAVVRALPRDRYEPVVIGIDSDGKFHLVPDEAIASTPRPGVPAIEDRLTVTGEEIEPAKLKELDVVFPLLHGPFGEDGTFQGYLETLGVPYAGCGVMASAIGMDKVAMKRAFRAENIPVTPYVHLDPIRWRDQRDLVEKLERPVFVKPANMGSSIGITRVVSDDDLVPAVEEALRYDNSVIVEQGVTGREIECGVLGGYEPAASAVGEVTVTGGWFDYRQKYLATDDPMIVPAVLPEHIEAEVRELSIRAFQAVGCWGLARVDFLYDEAAGAVFVNELNTMPGFTAHSMYPKVWAESGISYPELVSRLIDLAFERQAIRRRRVSGGPSLRGRET